MKKTKLEKRNQKKALLRDKKGGTDFVELLIMIALICFVVIAGVQAFGGSVLSKFTEQAGDVAGI